VPEGGAEFSVRLVAERATGTVPLRNGSE